MEHIHAEILRAIADGKNIQYRPVVTGNGRKYTSIWYNFDVNDAEACYNLLCPLGEAAGKHEWRLAPKTIKIGQYEVPEPVREPLCRGQMFWVVSPFRGPDSYTWVGDKEDFFALGSGFVHLSKEAATQYYEALKILLSGTTEENM